MEWIKRFTIRQFFKFSDENKNKTKMSSEADEFDGEFTTIEQVNFHLFFVFFFS